MNTKYFDLYTDYLAVTFGYATAAGLSHMLDGNISHDKFTRFPADGEWSSRNLWKKGINMLNCLYHVGDVSVPAAFELIRKPIRFST